MITPLFSGVGKVITLHKFIQLAMMMKCSIETDYSRPIDMGPYPIPLTKMQWVNHEMKRLKSAEIIVDSSSPWGSTVLVVRKKDGGQCMVIYYRSPGIG